MQKVPYTLIPEMGPVTHHKTGRQKWHRHSSVDVGKQREQTLPYAHHPHPPHIHTQLWGPSASCHGTEISLVELNINTHSADHLVPTVPIHKGPNLNQKYLHAGLSTCSTWIDQTLGWCIHSPALTTIQIKQLANSAQQHMCSTSSA